MDKYFKKAGSLDGDKYFKPAGNLVNEDMNSKKMTMEEIDDYLLSVSSGERYGGVCELGALVGGGKTIVDFATLKKMVDSGYNIISGKCINADRDMIEVEFQEYRKTDNMEHRRR